MPFSHEQFDGLLDWATQQAAGDADANAAVIEQARDAMMAYLGRSSLLKRYAAYIDRGRRGLPNTLTEPWQAEGERQYAALLALAVGRAGGSLGLADVPAVNALREQDAGEVASVGLALMILAAQVYQWSTAMENLADATPLPRHRVDGNQMPYPVMFWSTESAREDEAWETNWTALVKTPSGIRIFSDIVRRADNESDIHITEIPHGMLWPDECPPESRVGCNAILGRMAFLNSPYVGTATARLPRALRKLAAREGSADVDPEIHVVTLRREAVQQLDRQREDAAEGRVWKHQWWVSGHIRAQWYPSDGVHRLMWIAPYLKGDPSKPILDKVYAVAR